MTKLKLTFAAVALAASASVSADTILGVYAGAQRWDYDVEGSVRSGGSDVDLNNDLNVKGNDNNIYYIALEHPIPFLPNARIQQNNLDMPSTEGVTTQAFNFNGQAYNLGEVVNSTFDLTNTDYTLYYEVLDNWVNLDLGFTAKVFDGEATVLIPLGGSGSTPAPLGTPIDLSGTVPMLYGKAQFDLPFTGLSIGASGNFVSFGDDEITDVAAYISYESGSGLGIEAGYRTFEIEFDEFDNLSTNLKLDGAYVGINYHF